MKKVYISGPMTGFSKTVYQKRFAMAEHYLREKGFDVVNPSSDEYYSQHSLNEKGYADILLADLAALRACDAIYMLAGWDTSRGALAEHQFAKSVGIEILDL